MSFPNAEPPGKEGYGHHAGLVGNEIPVMGLGEVLTCHGAWESFTRKFQKSHC